MEKVSTIANKYPTYRDSLFRDAGLWLAGKRIDDNAEGLWRIHDKLYDMTDFISNHPGGAEWLEMTKGIDITEQFETHHLTDKAEKLLNKYYVRDAELPRNYKITFHPDGFYKTLKRRVASKLSEKIDKSMISTSKFYCDLMLASTLLSFVLAARDFNFLTALITAACLAMMFVMSHNFIHQRDNWRMYLMNFNFQNYRDWRVVHAMSHHLYPNSFYDIECTLFEPFFNWMPIKKSFAQKYGSWIMTPIVYAFVFPKTGFFRLINAFVNKNKLYWDDLLPYTMLILMYYFGDVGLGEAFLRWTKIIFLSSFIFAIVAVNGVHHHTQNFHDGDELKSYDFGVYQLATTFDRLEFQDNHFVVLTTFGQHIGHHFFPTIDHGLLPQLNEIIYDTIKEFEADLVSFPWYKLFIGQFKQLLRTDINRFK